MKGSTAMLAEKLSRNGVRTCASGHSAAPPGVSIHFVHWWSGSNVMEVGGGMTGCGIMHGGLVDAAVGACGGGVGERMVASFKIAFRI